MASQDHAQTLGSSKAEIAAEPLIEALLALPWAERADVFSAIRWNGIFCTACGIGERTAPNGRCQCENDT